MRCFLISDKPLFHGLDGEEGNSKGFRSYSVVEGETKTVELKASANPDQISYKWTAPVLADPLRVSYSGILSLLHFLSVFSFYVAVQLAPPLNLQRCKQLFLRNPMTT